MALVKCDHCSALNSPTHIYCEHCFMPLRKLSEIDILKREITRLESQFNQKITELKLRLHQLEQTELTPEPISISEPAIIPTPKPKPFAPVKTEIIEESRSKALEFFIGPFSELTTLAKQTYTHYKSEQKLPLFFLTLAGVITLLLGFGYFFQYTFSSFFSDTAKVSTGFIGAFILLWIGNWLSKKEEFTNYGSALSGLAISLHYLSIYFLTTYFGIVTPLIGFFLIVLNTAFAIWLALRNETRTVAVLSLIGGALGPFYIETTLSSLSLYFLYLASVLLACVYLSKKIKWKTLNVIGFSVTLVVIETLTGISATSETTLLWLIVLHGFLYFFVSQSLFFPKRMKMDKSDFVLFIGSITGFVINLFLIETHENTAIILGINSLLFLALGLNAQYKFPPPIRTLLIISASSLIGLAIPLWFTLEVSGIFWAQESLLLLVCGYLFQLPKVRKKAYGLFIFALVMMAFSSTKILFYWNQSLFHAGYFNFVALGFTCGGLLFIFKKYASAVEPYEEKISSIIREATAFWGISIFYITTLYFYGSGALIFTCIPLLGGLFIAERFNLKYTGKLAFSLFGLLLLPIIRSIDQTESFHLSNQTITAKIAIFETLMLLWGIQSIYHRWFKKDARPLVLYLRECFYLLMPFLLIPLVRTLFPEAVSASLWGSLTICYLLFKKLHHRSLYYELLLLSALAWFFSFVSVDGFFEPKRVHLLLGSFLFLGVFIKEKVHLKRYFWSSDLQLFFVVGHYYLISFLGIEAFLYSEKQALACLFISVLLFLSTKTLFSVALFRKYFLLNYYLAQSFVWIGVLGLSLYREFDTTVWICLAVTLVIFTLFQPFLHKPHHIYFHNLNRWKRDLLLFHLNIFVTYSIFILLFVTSGSGAMYTILLVSHAVLLLFYSIKPRYNYLNKLALIFFGSSFLKLFLFDLEQFSLFAKIIVFMVLGFLLLVSAYGYQKMIKPKELA